jgi:hypothetical protein
MKKLNFKFWSSAFLFFIMILVSSCNLEESAQAPDLTNEISSFKKPGIPVPSDYIAGDNYASRKWMKGEGWVKARNIPYILESISTFETQSYDATLKGGKLTGMFEVVNRNSSGVLEAWASGNVICMVFEEDCKTVRLVGKITKTNVNDFVGRYAIWIAEDNGAGLDATTDIRWGISENSANYHCEIGFTKEDFSIDGENLFIPTNGNIKVKSMDCFGNATGKN